MIIALSTLFKELFVQKVMSEVVAEMSAEMVGEAIEQLMTAEDELAGQKLQILEIESDTWYTFHLASADSWRKGLYLWAQVLQRELPRRYLYTKSDGGGPGSVKVPFISNIQVTDRDLLFHIRKLSGTQQPMNKQAVREAIIDTVRDTIKAYVRCVAADSLSFPEDYEGV